MTTDPVQLTDDDFSSRSKRIAVLQLGKLGDMILTTPLFTGLKRLYPTAHLTVIASNYAAHIPQHHPAVDRVIGAPHGFFRLPVLASRLHRERFDIYIDPKDHPSTTSDLIADMVHAERTILHRSNRGHRAVVTHFLPPDQPAHFVEKMLTPLRILAPKRTFKGAPTITIPQEAYRAVEHQINPGENGMIAINVSAGAPIRHWAPHKWKALIEEIARQYNVAVLSSPEDRSFADEICTMREEARPIRTVNILEAAAVIAQSRAVISPDTSIIHLASAFNIPTVGLYPPDEINLRSFAPLAQRQRVLMPMHGTSIAEISLDEVLRAFEAVMSVVPAARASHSA